MMWKNKLVISLSSSKTGFQDFISCAGQMSEKLSSVRAERSIYPGGIQITQGHCNRSCLQQIMTVCTVLLHTCLYLLFMNIQEISQRHLQHSEKKRLNSTYSGSCQVICGRRPHSSCFGLVLISHVFPTASSAPSITCWNCDTWSPTTYISMFVWEVAAFVSICSRLSFPQAQIQPPPLRHLYRHPKRQHNSPYCIL